MAKITAYTAPASFSNQDIMQHNEQLQELQNLWNANKLHPDVQTTELTRIHQLVMTLKKVTKSDNSLLSQVPSIKTTPAWPRATGSGLNENASIATQEWLRPTGSGPSEKRPRATSVSGSDLRLV